MRDSVPNLKKCYSSDLSKIPIATEYQFKTDSLKSTNLESIINNCRLLIITDSVKNKPRKIILDSKSDSYRHMSPRNKETQRLSEIVFGNFCLSSKSGGFKLHILKNPAEVIMSKLFNAPFSSIFYDNKASYYKVSPDSGNNQSFSSNSSFNSICSSNQSPINSLFHCPQSVNSNESVSINQCFTKSSSRSKIQNIVEQSSVQSPGRDVTKNGFFNENFENFNYKNFVMMSAIFIFSLPDENKAEFEEFLFQYYTVLESVLNRIAQLILHNCHNIYNGNLIHCWKESKRWLVSLLPKYSSAFSTSLNTNSNERNTSFNKFIDVKTFEELVDYFSKENRLSFLAQIISAILITNPNASSKYLKASPRDLKPLFPYAHILQNLGINLDEHTYGRIIVKGSVDNKKTPSSSWKARLSTSLNYCKRMWSLQSDNILSCSEIDISTKVVSQEHDFLTKTVSQNTLNECKEVQMITALIAGLIRPLNKVIYHPHLIPTDMPTFDNCRRVELSNKKIALEIPLLENGLILDQEVLPESKELFFPNIIADRIIGCLVPLQGLVTLTSLNNFKSNTLLESKQSEVAYNNDLYNPNFLVIDTSNSSVMIESKQWAQSNWVQELVNDFAVLIKVLGYDNVIGQLFLESAFVNLAQKRSCINQLSKPVNPLLMTMNGFMMSDVSLIMPKEGL